MAERDRVLAYLAALVAAFVLAFLAGRVAAPALDIEPTKPTHSTMLVTP